MGKCWRPTPIPKEVSNAELGKKHGAGADPRLPWDFWPKEAPEEGDDEAPGDYQAPRSQDRRPAEEG